MIRLGMLRLSAGLLAAVTGTAALASPREDLVRDWLTAASFGLPVTIGKSAFDPASQSVVMEDVVIGGLDKALVEIRYPSLTVEDPRRTPDGLFAAHAIRFANVTARARFDLKTLTPDVYELARKGEQGAGADAKADTKAFETPISLSFKIESGLFERVVTPFAAPAIDGKTTSFDKLLALANYWRSSRVDWFEYNNVSYGGEGASAAAVTETSYELIYGSGLHDGRVERSGANGMKQALPLEPGKVADFTIDQIRMVGYDFGRFVDVLYGTGTPDKAWRTIMELCDYSGIKVVGPEDSFTVEIGSIDAKGWRIRSADKPLVGLIQTMIANPDAMKKDPFPILADLIPAAAGLYGIDSAAMSDLSVKMPGDTGFTLGAMEVENLDADGLGAFTLRNAEVKAGPSGSGSLDHFTINNVRFGSLLAYLKLGESAEGGAEPDPKLVLDAVLEGSPTVDFVELSGLTVDSPAGSVGLDSVAITESNWYKALAQRYDLTFTRFSMPVSLVEDPTMKDQLTKMGYEQIAVSGATSLAWDVQKGDINLEDLTVKVADMGVLSADLRLGNLPISAFLDPATIETRLQEATVVDGSITFGNGGIVEKTFEVQAKAMNQKPDDFRRSFGDAMPLMLGFLEDKRIQDKFAGVLKTFFNDPKSVSLTFKPQAPLPFTVLATMQTEAPGAILDLLKVDVTANQ